MATRGRTSLTKHEAAAEEEVDLITLEDLAACKTTFEGNNNQHHAAHFNHSLTDAPDSLLLRRAAEHLEALDVDLHDVPDAEVDPAGLPPADVLDPEPREPRPLPQRLVPFGPHFLRVPHLANLLQQRQQQPLIPRVLAHRERAVQDRDLDLGRRSPLGALRDLVLELDEREPGENVRRRVAKRTVELDRASAECGGVRLAAVDAEPVVERVFEV